MGQHFLADGGTARAIAAALPPDPPRVLEIGPGRGALTRHLLERFPRVVAVELDAGLARQLRRALGDPPGLEVVHADALDVDLDGITGGERFSVAANLPYSVGTPIIRRLLGRRDLFEVLVVMLQKEVAERMVAAPGGDRGLLTLETELHAEAERLMVVPPGRFSPPPKVMSWVLLLRLIERPADEGIVARALELASAAFVHRRKTLANSLGARADGVPTALEAAGLRADVRPQALSARDWLALARLLRDREGGR